MGQESHLAGDLQAQPARLWRRFIAFFVDGVILAALLIGLGLSYYDEAVALGEWGRLLGLAVALLYFTVFDSRWGGGRSPGKRLLGISVIRIDGALLSPEMAALRTAILYAPITLNSMPVGADTSLMVMALLSLIVFGFFLSLAYLILFNRSRRSLHDLVAGAMVVDARTPPAPFSPLAWKGHWVVVGCIFALAFAAPFIVTRFVTGTEQGLQQLWAIHSSVVSLPSVRTAQLGWKKTTVWTPQSTTVTFDGLQVIVQLRARPADSAALAREIEDAIFADHAQIIGEKDVLIVMSHGFNFGGVAAFHSNVLYRTSIAEWRKRSKARDA